MRACYGSAHVPLPPVLTLPRPLWGAQRAVARFDRDLRLRRSVEAAHLFVLERRIRKAPLRHVSQPAFSDWAVQLRDGYIHISTVAPEYVRKPHRLIAQLKESGADTWDQGGAARIANELEYEDTWARITRKRRRLQLFREIAREAYDPLSRLGFTGNARINNPGVPSPIAATP